MGKGKQYRKSDPTAETAIGNVGKTSRKDAVDEQIRRHARAQQVAAWLKAAKEAAGDEGDD